MNSRVKSEELKKLADMIYVIMEWNGHPDSLEEDVVVLSYGSDDVTYADLAAAYKLLTDLAQSKVVTVTE